MQGNRRRTGFTSLLFLALLAVAVVSLLPGCPKNIAQDKRTGSDGRSKGARSIFLENGEGKTKGIVTYPGGDRVDWKSVTLPEGQVGTLSLKLSWRTPRPGLALGFDVFDEYGKRIVTEKGGKKKRRRSRSRSADIEFAKGKYFIRVYAPFRGDAGAYTLRVAFTATGDSGFDWTTADVPEPPRLPAVPASEVPCDPINFDRKNPACANVCPSVYDPNWLGCEKQCPRPPDVNNPACWATMPCPTPPRKEVKACRTEDFPECDPDNRDPKNPRCEGFKRPSVRGKIINVQATSDGTIITINRGEEKNVKLGWSGRLLRPSGKALEGSDFKIIKVTKREAVAKVRLNTDTVNANRDVELEEP